MADRCGLCQDVGRSSVGAGSAPCDTCALSAHYVEWRSLEDPATRPQPTSRAPGARIVALGARLGHALAPPVDATRARRTDARSGPVTLFRMRQQASTGPPLT